MWIIRTLADIVLPSEEYPRRDSVNKKTDTPLPEGKNTKYHLVLSGGWLRGFAHIGVYKALAEYGYEIASVAGTSMGALVGVFIAAKKTPEEIERIFTQKSVYKLLNISFSKDGMFSAARIQDTLKNSLEYENLEDLPLPFTVCVTDYGEAKALYYTEWKIDALVMASCAIPWIFEPISYENKLLVDGGIFDNMPVWDDNDLPIIWSHVNPRIFDSNEPTKDIAMRSIELMLARDIPRQREKCDIYFESQQLASIWFGLGENPSKIIQIGYKHACEVLKEIKFNITER